MFLLVFDIFLLLQIVGVYILFWRDVRKQVVEEAEFVMKLEKLEFERWVQDNAEYFARIITKNLEQKEDGASMPEEKVVEVGG